MLQKDEVNNQRKADWEGTQKSDCRMAVGVSNIFNDGEVITVIGQQLPEMLSTDDGIVYAMYDTTDGRQVSYKQLFRPAYVPVDSARKAGDEVSRKVRVKACTKTIAIDFVQVGRNRIPVLAQDTKLTVSMVRGHKAAYGKNVPKAASGNMILGEEEDIPTFE